MVGVLLWCVIQALVRGFLASRRVHWLRMEQRKAWVVTKVQTLIRKYLAVVAVMRMRVELQQRNYAATCIQCMYRCWKARRRVERRRAELFLQLCMRMATHVQRVWRGVLGRRRVQSIKEARALLLARQLRGAVDIERVYRGEREEARGDRLGGKGRRGTHGWAWSDAVRVCVPSACEGAAHRAGEAAAAAAEGHAAAAAGAEGTRRQVRRPGRWPSGCVDLGVSVV